MSASDLQRLSDQSAQHSGLTPGELERLAEVARRAAEAGASQLLAHFGRLESIREKGRAGDLVTEADVAAEQAVLSVLERETPELGVLAEESGRRPGRGSELEWCVDPLDGTTNYAHRYPFFGTSIGLTWKGQPLLGALAVPALQQLYWAAPGLGAWCNASRIEVSDCSTLASSLLVTGFAYDRHERLDNNYAEFADGRLAGYWERGLSPWDLAAGVALVEQAGGVVCAYDGGAATLAEGRLIACTPGLRQALIDGLAACRPLTGASFGAPELDRADP